jgi:HEPN domain-containing protein
MILKFGAVAMANRYGDWLRQAAADLRHARNALEDGDFEWSCFASHQAVEKAIKALYLYNSKEAWGHTLSALLGALEADFQATDDLMECSKALDKHYIPTRYPNGFDSGAPTDFYTRGEAEGAIDCAERIIEFCRSKIR